MLWASLYFPALALDVYARACSDDDAAQPFAVASGGNAPHVVAANDAARDAGIRPGQSIATALALAPEIVLRDRDTTTETRALAQLATWTLRFTPQVSLAAQDAIVLEIGASLRLFGGLAPLVARIRRGIEKQGYAILLGIAPTPTAALLLARADRPEPVRAAHQLSRALGSLSLKLLDIDSDVLTMLTAAGITTFGEAASLPRDALARRCGASLVTTLDRALARVADPRAPFVPPPHFESRLELPVPVADVEALSFATNRLVHELAAWLSARGLGAVRLSLTLMHEHYLQQRGVAPTQVPFMLGTPARMPAHLIGVLRERLARVALPAPVEAMILESEETAPLAGRNLGLLPGDDADAAQVPLVDRLRARLGDDAVLLLAPHAEHRPEKSNRQHIATSNGISARKKSRNSAPLPDAPRPLWLLDEAEPLQHRLEQAPWVLKDGPERIESGWWDGNDLRRDYFVAETPDGAIVWIYR
ncbi:MAG TPA: DNA polymerase Y family protein, partial [Casimicrobiaceae bacterium]